MNATFHALTATDFPSYPERSDRTGDERLETLLTNLTISPVSAKYFKCSPEWRLPPRTLPDAYWSWIVSGEATLTLEGKKSPVGPDSLVLFPTGIAHAMTPKPGVAMEMINVHFHARLYDAVDALGLFGLKGVFRDDPAGLYRLASMELARGAALAPAGQRRYARAWIETVLFNAIYRFADIRATRAEETRKLSLLYPALKTIEARLDDPRLSAADLAEKINVSPVYLRKLFRALFGEGPTRFIQRRRVERAGALLRETALPIKKIAEMSGFNDLSFFYRIFTRRVGARPGEYRENPEF